MRRAAINFDVEYNFYKSTTNACKVRGKRALVILHSDVHHTLSGKKNLCPMIVKSMHM